MKPLPTAEVILLDTVSSPKEVLGQGGETSNGFCFKLVISQLILTEPGGIQVLLKSAKCFSRYQRKFKCSILNNNLDASFRRGKPNLH
ncbi:Hypothetical predicted protein [Podarcis lilfordi]|uniref:Uncharacterized protein n=1 Tax=Podarcis lilfordi TaxID=74358 RepID=A0AA35KA03_9SAUR|nr:Hypothetical predicted protein [Podarcis lilfordi]